MTEDSSKKPNDTNCYTAVHKLKTIYSPIHVTELDRPKLLKQCLDELLKDADKRVTQMGKMFSTTSNKEVQNKTLELYSKYAECYEIDQFRNLEKTIEDYNMPPSCDTEEQKNYREVCYCELGNTLGEQRFEYALKNLPSRIAELLEEKIFQIPYLKEKSAQVNSKIKEDIGRQIIRNILIEHENTLKNPGLQYSTSKWYLSKMITFIVTDLEREAKKSSHLKDKLKIPKEKSSETKKVKFSFFEDLAKSDQNIAGKYGTNYDINPTCRGNCKFCNLTRCVNPNNKN